MFSPQAIFETGRRNNQEDSLYPVYGTASADDRLFIVCDGTGSTSNGNLASKTISNCVASYLRRNTSYDKSFPTSMLGDALDHACQELNKKGGAAEGQGTSFAFLYFHRGGVTAAYLGDSRIYHIRPNSATAANGTANKAIQFVSRDVSGGVSAEGEGAEGQGASSSRLILANSTTKPRTNVQHISDVRQGDYFVICTRGMLENLTDEDLVQLLSEKGSDEKKRKQLIAATIDNNENHSAYILHVENVMAEAGDDDYSSSDISDTISYGPYGTERKKRSYGKVLSYLIASLLALAVIYLGYDYFANRPSTPKPKEEVLVPDSTVKAPLPTATAETTQKEDTIAKPETAAPQVTKPVKTTARTREEQSASSWLYDNSGSSTTTPKPAEQTETKPEAPAQKPAAAEPVQPAAPQPAASSEGASD